MLCHAVACHLSNCQTTGHNQPVHRVCLHVFERACIYLLSCERVCGEGKPGMCCALTCQRLLSVYLYRLCLPCSHQQQWHACPRRCVRTLPAAFAPSTACTIFPSLVHAQLYSCSSVAFASLFWPADLIPNFVCKLQCNHCVRCTMILSCTAALLHWCTMVHKAGMQHTEY
jgi:hypothetical protein